jgi:SAM-dependent methyltransferase
MVETLDRVLYPGFTDHWDDCLFRERIVEIFSRHKCRAVLDLGAGSGRLKQMNFRGLVERVCGVDPDPRVLDNPFLDEARVGRGEAIPYPSSSFDMVIANNLLEHLDNPLSVFCEVSRVLRPGGYFLAKTPNKWHYAPISARLTPHKFHRWFNSKRGRSENDTYPTKYLANTPRSVRRLARAARLEEVSIELIEGRPEYLRFSTLTYVLGASYERLVNRFTALRSLRVLLVITLQRAGAV